MNGSIESATSQTSTTRTHCRLKSRSTKWNAGLIVATLKRCDGHRAKAAEKLGIGLRTLSGKLRAYGYAPREKDFANAE